MADKVSFKLPKSFITQLGEFTTGYILMTVNEDGQFETFIHADTPVIKLGLAKYSTVMTDAINDNIENSMLIPPPTPEAPGAAEV